MRRHLVISLAAVSSVIASMATAATVTLGADSFGPATLVAADNTTGQVFQNVTGSVGGLRADPWAGTAFAGSGAYTSVSRGASATYTLPGAPTNSYSFLWGTPDSYNTLRLVRNGVVVDSIAGNGTGIANFADQRTNRFVTVSSVFVFDTLLFESDSDAFEFAMVSPAPVPLPAAGGLLLFALGGAAVVARRKKA